MHLRRTFALAGAILMLALPLSSCGFDYATDRIYTPAAGANNRGGVLDVLGAAIVSAQPNSGTFVATFTNTSATETESVESIQGTDGNQGVTAPSFTPVEVKPAGLVNLAREGGVKVTGTFQAGDYVPMVVRFGGGSQIKINVPVVTNCEEFKGLDGSGGDCSYPSPTPTTSTE